MNRPGQFAKSCPLILSSSFILSNDEVPDEDDTIFILPGPQVGEFRSQSAALWMK